MTPRTVGIAGGGAIGLILILLFLCLGGDPQLLLQQMGNGPMPGQPGQVGIPDGEREVDPVQDELAQFTSVVLADTEEVWTDIFQQMGKRYEEPRLVLFRELVQSACGQASAATGPFYCPGDAQVYIDLDFFGDMEHQLKAEGDFARAYVVAHEVGHHVQNLLGISNQVHAAQQQRPDLANELSVRLELQADFLAGVWAHHAHKNWNILEEGDVEEAMNAATAIGDDRLQRRSQGYVVPESFTHGSSEQRKRWFMKGLRSGDLSKGDTFGIPYDDL